LTAGWLLVAGWACQSKGGKTMITEDQAVEIATKEFEKRGRPASDYDVTVTTYDEDARQWIVWFTNKGPQRPGGRHAVLVDKSTGETEFRAGQ
jgi:hypothetical protein